MAMNGTWPNPGGDTGAPDDEAVASQALFAWYAPGFSDPLGDRLLLFDNTARAPLELLRLRGDLSQVPGFESLVRDRAAALADFEDRRHAHVVRVDRLPDPGGGLAVVSAGTEGQRLSEILRVAEQRQQQPGRDIVRSLVAEIVAAVATFHELGADIAHGALGPDRLIVSPHGQLVVTEYVLGSALARVPLDRTALWRDLRLALPFDPALPSFDQRTDVVQFGCITLALVLGRMLSADDYPSRLEQLLTDASQRLMQEWGAPGEPFRDGLALALQMNGKLGFGNALEANRALNEVLAADSGDRRGGGIEDFITACSPAPGALPGFEFADSNLAPPVGSPAVTSAEHANGLPATIQAAAPPAATAAAPEPPAPAKEQALPIGDSQPDGLQQLREALRLPPADRGAAAQSSPWLRWQRIALVVLALVALAEGVFIGVRALRGTPRGAVSPAGIVTIESNPGSANVTADGKAAGVTPVRLQLPPGRHVLEVSAGARRRTFEVTTVPGTSVSHYVELPETPVQTGKIRVVTAAVGLRVLVDGRIRGTTPVTVSDLAPGPHEVVVESRHGNVRQSVDVEANSTASLFVPTPGGNAPAPGWVTIDAPLELRVYEDGQLLGTSKSERIMLAAGHHEVQLVNETVGYRSIREFDVPVGRTATVEVTLPTARVDINAVPWAEVTVDGRPVGQTPLSGVSLTLGPHSVTFTHPQLGERTVQCTVTMPGPTRVSADLRK